MTDLLSDDTDFEISKYYEASDMIDAGINPAIEKNKKSVFNPETGINDVLLPMSSGGYVKISEEAPEVMAEAPMQPAMPSVADLGPTGGVTDVTRSPMRLAGVVPSKTSSSSNVISETVKGLARGGIVRPAQFLKENFDIYDPLVIQIVNPVTGEFDPDLKILSREEKEQLDADMAAGNLPYAFDFEKIVETSENAGIAAQLAGGISQFVGAFAGLGKLFRIGKGITGGITQGAAADFLAFRGDEGRITDLLLEMGVDESLVPSFLVTDPNDPDYVGRFKTAFEGGVFGGLAEPAIRAIGKTYRGIKDGDMPAEEIDQAVEAGKQSLLQTVIQRLNQPGPMPTTSMFGAGEIDDIRVDRVEAPTEEKPGIIAFHGSGADFDEFKLDKINTGEGAQAFGYGLYFTDSEDIALFYKSAVRQAKDLREGYDVTYKGQPFKNLGDTPEAEAQGEEYFAVNAIIDSLNKVTTITTRDLPQPELLQLAKEKAIEQVEQQIKSFGDDISEIRLNHLNESLDTLKSVDVNDVSFSKGKTYQVKLDVTPDELLDYDKPFNEQSLFAQQAILKTLDEMTLDDAVNMGVDLYGPPYNGKINKNTEQMAIQEAQNLMLKDFSVVRFLNDWSVLRGAENSGEELLEKNGIKGIKYKANRGPGARNVPETGSDNYVIFDDKLIQIMKKYGIVGPVVVTAMKSEEQEET